MTWLPERAPSRLLARAAWLAMLTAVTTTAADVMPAPVPALPAGVVSNELPRWMELSVLATNANEWADLANIWRRNPDADASPVEKLTLPVEHYDNGRIRAVLYANRAVVGTAGLIWSWQVAVDLFDPVGAPDGRVEAESCLYDRNARRGYCPTAVKLVRTNATITGTGLYWTMTTQRMQILSNPVVRLQQNVRFTGSGASATTGSLRGERVLLPERDSSGGGTTK